jgi:chromosome segregation ATPase
MPTGDNKVNLNCTTELKQFIDGKKGDLYPSFHMALAYLEHYKTEFIAKYGEQVYNEHVARYSISAVKVRDASNQKKLERIAEKRRELDIREKELELKSKFLSAETNIMNDKHDDKIAESEKRNRKKIEALQDELIPVKGSLKRREEALVSRPDLKGNLEPLIAQDKEKIAELEAQIAQLKPQQEVKA